MMKINVLQVCVPCVSVVDNVKMEFTFEQARKLLPKALAPLGDDNLQVPRDGLDPKKGWIGIYPHKDKDSGAFSASVFGAHP